VEQISADKDTLLVTSQTVRSMALATPQSTPYYNYHVGECKNLIFGVSLVDYANSRGLSEGEVPHVVDLCINEIDKRGLEVEGIYRVRKIFTKQILGTPYFYTDFWETCKYS
jgi:Rho GTPase-activating protein 12/27